jgi:ribosomal protein S25
MNLSSIRLIYNNVGEEKCKSLLISKSNKPKKDTDARPIKETTIDMITGLIKRHKNPTRRTVIAKSYLSPSTVNNAIRILFERGVISKNRKEVGSGCEVSYSIKRS